MNNSDELDISLKFRSTLPESWAANSFKKLHESLGFQGAVSLKTEIKETIQSTDDDNGVDKTKEISSKSKRPCNIDEDNKDNEKKENVTVEIRKLDASNPFMQLTYAQKDICVGSFWETFSNEAANQGISPASFATFLGARAAIPGPSAPQGAWGQFSAGNRSVLDTFRKLRYGEIIFIEIKLKIF